MSIGLFVSGTDTGIGKTRVSVGLLAAAQRLHLHAVGMKPIASGCEASAGGWRNADALALQAASSAPRPTYQQINPVALALPIAPHLAAQADGTLITLAPLLAAYRGLATSRDLIVVEGVGGWAVPLSDRLMQADLVRTLAVPVLLVVGIRLGAINHALLSAQAIRAAGVPLIGWIANCIDPSLPFADLAIAAISERIAAPLLTEVPHHDGAGCAAVDLAFDQALRAILTSDAGNRSQPADACE